MDANAIALIQKLQDIIASQRETLANHKNHIEAIQTSQFIMLKLILEYDPELREFIINSLTAAQESTVVGQDPHLKAHLRELLRIAETSLAPEPDEGRPHWLTVIQGGKTNPE